MVQFFPNANAEMCKPYEKSVLLGRSQKIQINKYHYLHTRFTMSRWSRHSEPKMQKNNSSLLDR